MVNGGVIIMITERIIHKISSSSLTHSNLAPIIQKRKVAAYTRVSTSEENQLLSNHAQIDYYKQFISNHPNWIFSGLYADNGQSINILKFLSNCN